MRILIEAPIGSCEEKQLTINSLMCVHYLFHIFNNIAYKIFQSHKTIVQSSLSTNPAIQGSRFECKSWSHGLWQLCSICALHCRCAKYNL